MEGDIYTISTNGSYLRLKNGLSLGSESTPIRIESREGYRLLDEGKKNSVNLKQKRQDQGFQLSNWTTTQGNKVEENELFY